MSNDVEWGHGTVVKETVPGRRRLKKKKMIEGVDIDMLTGTIIQHVKKEDK